MCGLVGVFGDLDKEAKTISEELLWMDVIRGPHSTGAATLRHLRAKPRVIKQLGTADRLLQNKSFRQMQAANNWLVMGHNRWATKGAINAKNAHPFTHGDITLTHNGTLTTVYHLPCDAPHKYDTDTEALTVSIAEHGPEEAWAGLNGAATITYWDRSDKTLNLISNDKRPFHWCTSEDGKQMFWASEDWMLEGVLNRRAIKILDNQVYFPKKNVHYKFKWDGEKVVMLDGKKMPEYVNPYVYDSKPANKGGARSVVPFVQKNNESGTNGTSTNTGVGSGTIREPTKLFPEHEECAAFLGWGYISTQAIKEYTADVLGNLLGCQTYDYELFSQRFKSCDFCGTDLTLFEEYESAIVLDSNTAVCGQCAAIGSQNHPEFSKGILL